MFLKQEIENRDVTKSGDIFVSIYKLLIPIERENKIYEF